MNIYEHYSLRFDSSYSFGNPRSFYVGSECWFRTIANLTGTAVYDTIVWSTFWLLRNQFLSEYKEGVRAWFTPPQGCWGGNSINVAARFVYSL